jgi:S1-C subfamily serine protease
MRKTVHLMTTTALIVLLATHSVAGQTSSEIWRSFAEQVEVGTELNVRLNDGRHFKATLVGLRDNAMLMQPKTRVPVQIQAVPYDDVVRLERTKSGMGAGKAIAIGAATGVGAFFGILALMVSVVSD